MDNFNETMDYDSLNMLETINRPITSNHVTTLKRSISEYGNLRAVIVAKLTFITGTEQLYVLDGQHHLTALRALRRPVIYVMMNIAENYTALIKAIATLNTTSKKWALKDYVQAWKSVSNEYIQLERYHQRYSMSYVAIAMIALNIEKRSTTAPIIKNGTFRVTNANFVTIAEAAYDLLEIEGLGNINTIPERFIGELIRYYNNVDVYDHERIKENVRNNVNVIRAAATNTVGAVLREVVFNLDI